MCADSITNTNENGWTQLEAGENQRKWVKTGKFIFLMGWNVWNGLIKWKGLKMGENGWKQMKADENR